VSLSRFGVQGALRGDRAKTVLALDFVQKSLPSEL
jgi:hypothetical protein